MLDWIHQHGWAIVRTALVAVVATAAVVAVTAVTGGVGAPLLVPLLGSTLAPIAGTLLAGAAGGAAGYVAHWALSGPSRRWSWRGFLATTLLSAGLSAVAAPIVSAFAPRVAAPVVATAEGALDAAPGAAAPEVASSVARAVAPDAARAVLRQATVNAAAGAGFGVATQAAGNLVDNALHGHRHGLLDGAGYAAESGAFAGASAAPLSVIFGVTPLPLIEEAPTGATSAEAAAGITQTLERNLAVVSGEARAASGPCRNAATSAPDTGGNGPSGEDEPDDGKPARCPVPGVPAGALGE